jgi:hypothetical protein
MLFALHPNVKRLFAGMAFQYECNIWLEGGILTSMSVGGKLDTSPRQGAVGIPLALIVSFTSGHHVNRDCRTKHWRNYVRQISRSPTA